MKTTKLCLAALLLGSTAIHTQAQVVQENEMAIVYYMPQTELVVDVTYTQQCRKRGPFYLFAEEFLGIEDVIEQDEDIYDIIGAEIHTRTTPDYHRAHVVVPENGMSMQLLSLNEQGLLLGYNLPYEATSTNKKSNKSNHNKAEQKVELPAPYTEDMLRAQTMRQMAEATAKQIYRIRENRMYLLGGEIDHAPADGKAMQLVLDELNHQERRLIELFIGSTRTETFTKTVTYLPSKTATDTLFCFNNVEGIVHPQDVTGIPVVIEIQAHRQVLGAAAEVKDKKVPKPSQLYYNLPGTCQATISYNRRELSSRQLTIAQFGVAVPLSQDLFQNKQKPIIRLDRKTGNILSISQE